MTDERDENQREQRIRRPRRTSGFSPGGVSSSTETFGRVGDADFEERVIVDDESLYQPQTLPIPAGAVPRNQVAQPETEITMPERLRRLGRMSPEYAREYRLRETQKRLLAAVGLDLIATEFGISLSQVIRDRAEIGKRLREESKALDIDFLVGEGTQFYNTVLAAAMEIHNDANMPAAIKLTALRTAMGASADKARFLAATGVLDAIKWRKNNNDGSMTDIERLMQSTEDLLKQTDDPMAGSDNDAEVLDL